MSPPTNNSNGGNTNGGGRNSPSRRRNRNRNATNRNNRRRGNRRNYNRASMEDDDTDYDSNDDEMNLMTGSDGPTTDTDTDTSTSTSTSTSEQKGDNHKVEDKSQQEEGTGIDIQILDSAQHKFQIPTIYDPSTTTVKQLKQIGATIHKVPSEQQRLIYMGRLLQDDSTLKDSGMDKDSTSLIVHLFPKPTVVIHRDSSTTTSGSTNPTTNTNGGGEENGNNNEDGGGGTTNQQGHIPQIILDESEAQRSSTILVLTSHEAFEILHRVRLCSFCLLIYSIMNILQDFSLWINANAYGANNGNGSSSSSNTGNTQDDWFGIVPGDPTDTTLPNAPMDPFAPESTYDETNNAWDPNPDETSSAPAGAGEHSTNDPNGTFQWETIYYLDVILSIAALYIAMFGIKVTTDYTVVTTRKFTVMIFSFAVVRNILSYILMVRTFQRSEDWNEMDLTDDYYDSHSNDHQHDHEDELDTTSIYVLAFWQQSFSFFLWFMFLFWVWQFKKLIEEADSEAEERTRSLTDNAVRIDGNGTTTNAAATGNASEGGNGSTRNGRGNSNSDDYDLELQVEGRTIS